MPVHTYETDIHWSGERKGIVHSTALNEEIEVATPPEFKGGIPGIWSPEHLYVAAVNSCLMTTFLAIAENSKLQFSHFESHGTGKLDKVDGKYQMTEITLAPKVTIANPEDEEKARRILEMSEKACLISASIKTVVKLEPRIELEPQPAGAAQINKEPESV
jgi:peroxiredoxin-like protein